MERFSQIKYKRPRVLPAVARLLFCSAQASGAKTYGAVRSAYFKAVEIVSEVINAETLVDIRNSMNVADRAYERRKKVMSLVMGAVMPAVLRLEKSILASPFKKNFDSEFGAQLMRIHGSVVRTNSLRTAPLMLKEESLQSEYRKTAASCKTVFMGEECNFYGLTKHYSSTDRDERRAAFEEWAALYEGVSQQLDDCYDKLIALREKKARRLGFNSYIDYIYLVRMRFDYGPCEVAAFRDEIVKYFVPACSKLYEQQRERLGLEKLQVYDEELFYPDGNAEPLPSTEQKLSAASRMYGEMSDETAEFFSFMTEHELFDLETRQDKRLGGYCTFLPTQKAPFIFSNFNGTCADVDVLTHEAGHAFQAYICSRKLSCPEYYSPSYELCETHSMAMEHFAYDYMKLFFGDKSDKYILMHLTQAFTSVPYLAAIDEFQHRVFEAHGMDAARRRTVWREIEQKYLPWRDYDSNAFLLGGGAWMKQLHVFVWPFYYIDYALAQLCAFQFYLKSSEDRQAAWDSYIRLCECGGSKGYFETLEYAGLENPLKPGVVKSIAERVTERIRAMS